MDREVNPAEAGQTWGDSSQHTNPLWGHTTAVGSGIEYKGSTWMDGYWDHELLVAGHGAAKKDGELTNGIGKQLIEVSKLSSDGKIDLLGSARDEKNALHPNPGYDELWGQAVTGALGVAATVAGSTLGGLALGAAAIADSLLDAAVDQFRQSGPRIRLNGAYGGTTRVDRASHHGRFTVRQYTDTKDEGWGNVHVRSQIGVARNDWQVTVWPGNANAFPYDPPGPAFAAPEEMDDEAMSAYGIEQVSDPSELRTDNPAAISRLARSESTTTYEATRAPLTISPVGNESTGE